MVAEVGGPGMASGRVEVEVHFSAVSSGTEGSILSESGRTFVSRVIEKRRSADRIWKALRRRDLSDVRTRFERLASRGQTWIVPGYSASGIVRACGPEASIFAPGDRVAVAGAGYATHADLVTVPQNLVVRVPDGLSLAPASTAAVGAIALQAIRRADSRIGETVLVLGLGLIGQITSRILVAAGCRVLGWDPRAERLHLAATHGITALSIDGIHDVPAAVAALTAGQGADQVILAAAAGGEAVEAAARAARRAGALVLLGDTPVTVARETAYMRELDIRMSTSYGPGRYDRRYEEDGQDYPFAYVRWTENRNMVAWLELLAAGRVVIDDLIRAVRDMDEAGAAYLALRQGTLESLGLIFRHRDAASTSIEVAAGVVGAATGAAAAQPAETAAAGSGSTAPSSAFIPSSAPISPSAPIARRAPRSTPLRVAVLGTGAYATSGILPALVTLGGRIKFELLAGTVPARRDPLARQYEFARTSSSYEDAAGDPDTDLVVVVTRHDRRADLIVPALRTGHAVFTEKPLALRADEIGRIAAELERGGGFLMIGFNRRFAPGVARLREMLAGRRGPLQMAYRVQAGMLPEGHWVRGPQGGGRLVGEGVHMIDLFRALVAAPLEGAWVVPGGGAAGAAAADPGADNFQIGLRYADGSTATLLYTSRGSVHHPKERLEVHWDGRSIELDNYAALHESGRKALLWQAPGPRKGQPEMWQACVEALLSGGPAPIPAEEIFETSRAVLALERARRGE
ncbi:MAG: bi-domain-containing oxidoreductase [Candidatus Eisenbacteria bacterium]